MQEYGEHRDKIREFETEKAKIIAERDEARAELDKVSKKKTRLAEIDSIESSAVDYSRVIGA